MEQSAGKRGAYLAWAFWPLVCLLLCLMATRQIYALLQESETIDEGVHLVAGYSYWKTHDFRLTPSHPPLARLLCALPLILLQPDFAPTAEEWQGADDYAIAKKFLYQNKIPADTLLLSGRMMTVLVTVGFGVAIAGWTRRRFGSYAGLFSVFLFSLSPSIIAHGHYITTDMMVTALLTCTCLSLLDYLSTGTTRDLVQTGILMGLALASKFNGLIVYPIFLLIYLAYRWVQPGAVRWRHSLSATFAALALLPWLIVYSTFFFDTRSALEDPYLGPRLMAKTGITHLLAESPVPAYYYFRGLQLLLRDFKGGHNGYLLGKELTHGSWWYFPIAFAVKTPVSMLLLLVVCAALILSKLRTRTSNLFIWAGLGIPPIVYFLVSLPSSMNIGIRHLLPVYPFLFIVISGALFGYRETQYRRLTRIAGTLLGCLLVIESMSIDPDFLAYFNVLAGGPENGPHYLIDSNLDWGQDLKKLKRWVDRRKPGRICLSYFGQANPEYYGISYVPLTSLRDLNEVANTNCVVAVSAQLLYGTEADRFRALYDFTPDARIGYSIYVYDFRKDNPQ